MSMNRREFLKTSALCGGFRRFQFPAPSIAQAQNANSKLRIGVVGVSGRGAGNISELLNGSGDIVEIAALCGVDDNNLEAQGKNHPNAKRFFDYRTMLDETELDAILISTPDHTHAVAAMAAMKKGLPCFCEKPLAHDVAEIRAMQKIAKEKNLATQMGTVIHATENYRRVVELIQAGAVGEVNEVHVWCAKGWGGYPEPSKEKFDVPKHLHWDEWLGPAQWLDYNPCYLPGRWRGYWPFGTGTFGDMACHLMDLPFWALDLQYPKTISATCDAEISKMCCPLDVECKYEFEVNGKTLLLTWYDGVRRPAVIKDKNLADLFMGVIFVGDEVFLKQTMEPFAFIPKKNSRTTSVLKNRFRPQQDTIVNGLIRSLTAERLLRSVISNTQDDLPKRFSLAARSAPVRSSWNGTPKRCSLPTTKRPTISSQRNIERAGVSKFNAPFGKELNFQRS